MLFKISVQNKFQFRMIPNLKSLLFGTESDIHYIGGAEILPPPLEVEEEAEAKTV